MDMLWGTASSIPFSTIPQDHKITHSLVINITFSQGYSFRSLGSQSHKIENMRNPLSFNTTKKDYMSSIN
jgi:hypothetical protein